MEIRPLTPDKLTRKREGKMIKIKIDEDGFLWLRRGSELKEQFCQHMIECSCGDYCAGFGEPKGDVVDDGDICLTICTCRLFCKPDEFLDERD
mgnify:CR=1 FL=1